jgi:hypothetical protein
MPTAGQADDLYPETLLNARVSSHSGKGMERQTTLQARVVPEAGLEPAQGCPRGILSPLRLPIPPLRQGKPIFERLAPGVKGGGEGGNGELC